MGRIRIEDDDLAFPLFLWSDGDQIDLSHLQNRIGGAIYGVPELETVECHIKPDGARDRTPSICLVLGGKSGSRSYVQLTGHQLKPVINAIKALSDLKDLK